VAERERPGKRDASIDDHVIEVARGHRERADQCGLVGLEPRRRNVAPFEAVRFDVRELLHDHLPCRTVNVTGGDI
jgi:hypothetical protein